MFGHYNHYLLQGRWIVPMMSHYEDLVEVMSSGGVRVTFTSKP